MVGGSNSVQIRERRIVGGGVAAACRAPAREMRKLGGEHCGLQRVEAAVVADFVVVVGLDAAVRPQLAHGHRQLVALRDHHAAVAVSAEVLGREEGERSPSRSKNLGGYGDGGMMVTQDDALATRLKRLRDHGGAKTYFHDEVGYNSRLDALQAAVCARSCRTSRAGAPRGVAAERRVLRRGVRGRRRRSTPNIDPPTSRSSISTRSASERRDELQAHLKTAGHRHLRLLPASAAPPAVLRVPRLQEGHVPESERAARKCCRFRSSRS